MLSKNGRQWRGSYTAGALALGVMLMAAAPAQAYCRTTTCDLQQASGGTAECDDSTRIDGCATQGMPLHWPGGCVWYGTETRGSAKLGISSDALHAAVKQAFAAWADVDCGGGRRPSLELADTNQLYGAVECAQPEFNTRAANANVWMFSDAAWLYPNSASAYAITLTTASLVTGEIYDADVLLNSFSEDMAVEPGDGEAKLLSVVMHEAGHYLGLGHSGDAAAIMHTLYSADRVTLSDDDRAGICAAYPPVDGGECAEPSAKFGFSRHCGGANPSTTPRTNTPAPEPRGPAAAGGCSFTQASAPSWLSVLLAAALPMLARRRRVTRASAQR